MLNPQDYFDKHLLRLGRELARLWRRRYVTVALDEPIQRGWVRFHTLTAKAADRPDKEILLELLKAIGTLRFQNNPDFRTKRGRERRRRFIEIEQPLRTLTIGAWDRWRFPEDWQRYFRLECQRCGYRWRDELVFANPDLFELKVEPYWITEVLISDPGVEARIAEIDRWLWNRNAKFRMERLCDGKAWKRRRPGNRGIILEEIALRELRQALHETLETDPSASIRCAPISLRGFLVRLVSLSQSVSSGCPVPLTRGTHSPLTPNTTSP